MEEDLVAMEESAKEMAEGTANVEVETTEQSDKTDETEE